MAMNAAIFSHPVGYFVHPQEDFPAIGLRNKAIWLNNWEHARSRDSTSLAHTAIFEDPHHFARCAVLIEFGVGEVSGLNWEIFGCCPIPFSFSAMTS